MARIAGVDIPRDKRVVVSLTYIYGIGRPTAEKILAKMCIRDRFRLLWRQRNDSYQNT